MKKEANTKKIQTNVVGLHGTDLIDNPLERRQLRLGLLAAFLMDEEPAVGVDAAQALRPADPLDQLADLLVGMGLRAPSPALAA